MVRSKSHGEKQAGSPAEAAITEIETNLLWKISHLISGSMLQDDVIQTALHGVVDTVGCDVAILFLRRDGDLELKAMVPTNSRIRIDAAVGHRIGECLCGLAVRDGGPVYSLDITRDPRCTFQECKNAGMRSFAAGPDEGRGRRAGRSRTGLQGPARLREAGGVSGDAYHRHLHRRANDWSTMRRCATPPRWRRRSRSASARRKRYAIRRRSCAPLSPIPRLEFPLPASCKTGSSAPIRHLCGCWVTTRRKSFWPCE